MSILIKGMEMPENCGCCKFHRLRYNTNTQFCVILDKNCSPWYERKAWCPLSDVPTPHGRLINADALKKKVLMWLPSDPYGKEEKEFSFETDICVSMLMEIEEAETIIEAEE